MTSEPEITIHRNWPPPDRDDEPKDGIGYVRAEAQGVHVLLPCSFPLLDDQHALDHYIKLRLLPYLQLEIDRVT